MAFAALLFLSSLALADKAVDQKTEKKSSVVIDIKKVKEAISAKLASKQTADKRIDTVDEKSDIVEAAASANYEAGAPVSQGNLYYYYYPVAAYPVHADDKVSSSGSSITDSPLVFILVPLVLLLIAVPVISILLNNNR